MGWGGEPIEGFSTFEKEKDLGASRGRGVGAQPKNKPLLQRDMGEGAQASWAWTWGWCFAWFSETFWPWLLGQTELLGNIPRTCRLV